MTAVRRSHTIAVLLASLSLASPQLARAQPHKPSAKDLQLASDLVKKAIARSQAGDHAAAIEIYLQANTLAPNPLLLSNIGSEYQQDNMLEDALTYFCMYLDKDPTGTNAPYARAQAKILQRRLGNKSGDDDEVCVAPRSTAPPKPAPSESQDAIHDRAPPPDAPPVAEGRPNRTLLYVGVTTGAIGVVATGIGLYYAKQGHDLNEKVGNYDPITNNGWYPGVRQDQADGEHDNDMQIRFLVAGGALMIGGAVMMWLGWPDAHPHGGQAIHVTPTRNGVAVFGAF
jgi:tetratricopeptide (TPR) repeat protein